MPKPLFVWLNPSRMHLFTDLAEEDRNLTQPFPTELGIYGSCMMQHDRQAGELLDQMQKLGVLDSTIIIYSTDDGPEHSHSARQQGGTTCFQGEKITTYEGGLRVAFIVRWPGHVPAGQILNGVQAHMGVFPMLAAAAGVPDAAALVLAEKNQVLDGVGNLDYWKDKSDVNSYRFLYYFESDIKAVRIWPRKLHFATSDNCCGVYQPQKFPIIFNLRMDPFASYDEVADRFAVLQREQWLNEPVQELFNEHIQTLTEHPPVQAAASYNFSELIRQVTSDVN